MATLSGGEAQRVRMAALVAQDAAWWLLDEPMNHLDPAVRLELCGVLVDRARAGGSIVLVSHDLGLLPHLGPARIVLLAAGRVVHQGRATDPDLAEPLGAAFGLRLRRVPVGTHWAFVTEGARA
jgi:iron complex transport system ATP-binding protein